MSILQALHARHERLAARGDLPPYGFSTERIGFAITLSAEGEPVTVLPLGAPDGKKGDAGVSMSVPRSFKRPGVTPRAFFTWDNSKFVLGIGTEKAGKEPAEYPTRFAAFHDLHRTLLGHCDDVGARALLRFLDQWTAERFAAPPFTPAMLDANIVFMLDGEDGYLHDRPAIRRVWERQVSDDLGAEGFCLVTGERAPIATIHPAIKGVMGAQSSGASIVSFNQSAFTSYGKAQGANAPVSQAVADGYVAVLNAMLSRDSRNRLQIADATTVFWADAALPADAALAEGVFAFLNDPPPLEDAEDAADKLRSADAQEAAKLRNVLSQIAEGRPLAEIAPGLAEKTRFYVLGLSPNIARLSVRFWIERTFGEMEANFRQHWDDTAIDPWPWKNPKPSVLGLLRETALLRELKNIPDHLTGEVMRAILTGQRYPRTLLAAVITRMRADQHISGRRAAICRAVLVRDHRVDGDFPARLTTDEQKKEYLVSLDREETNPGYLLGRLFAVLENAQYNALGRINATIRDRYYGAASATPASVFPLLLRTGAHHIAVLRKEGKGGWVDQAIAEIMDKMGSVFPKSLSIENQGRFAIGYYHQRAYRKPGEDGAAEPVNTDNQDQEVEG